jgi:hypothetical protein
MKERDDTEFLGIPGGENNSGKLLKLIHNLDMIPITSSKCERAFSQMNLTVIQLRSFLLTKTSEVMFIKTVAPTLSQFAPTKLIESWLIFGHHSATEAKK